MQGERYIAAADLGSSKIALCVAKVEGDDVQVIYYKEMPSDGIRYSCVFNPKRASAQLKNIINDAESELNIKILQLVVGLPRYQVRQELANAKMQRSRPETCISKEEIDTLKSIAIDNYPLDNDEKQKIYGAVAQSFSADNELVNASENDIVGVSADSIEGNFKVFIGNQKAVSNIDIMLNEVGVAPAYKFFVPGSIAGVVLTETEKENGVALVEIGAGVSSLTIYKGKRLRHYSSIPFGGKNITNDIKYECGFNEALAENIKLAFGACMPDKLQSLSDKVIQINDDENGSYEQLPVKYLSEIITCRSKELVDALLFHIQESGFADSLRSGVVLTGGCANLVNLANFIKQESGYNVRIGYPRTQVFSSGGCPGVGETGAVATIGMILEAKKDYHLNCIEAAPVTSNAEEEEENGNVEQNNVDENGQGILFGGEFGSEVIQTETNTSRRNKKKKDSGKGESVVWTKLRRFGNKVNSGLEGAFDSTVGELFDSMK